jgi:hypothetical protein
VAEAVADYRTESGLIPVRESGKIAIEVINQHGHDLRGEEPCRTPK